MVCRAWHAPWGRKESETTEWLNWTETSPQHIAQQKNAVRATTLCACALSGGGNSGQGCLFAASSQRRMRTLVSGRSAHLSRRAQGAGAAGKMAGVGLAAVAAWVPCRRWGLAAVTFGFHHGLSTLLARKTERAPQWLRGQCPKDWSKTRSFEHSGFRRFLSLAFLALRSEILFPGSQYPSSF